MTRLKTCTAFALLLLGNIARAETPVREDRILIWRTLEAGRQTVQALPDGKTRVEFSYNDRGRGDHIVATWRLDARGIPVEYEGDGNDYWKAPVVERFTVVDGRASWKNGSEQGEKALSGGAFFLPLHAPPEFYGVLGRALLQAPGRHLPLLPDGEGRIEEAGRQKVDLPEGPREVVQYHIFGLALTPVSLWLDQEGRTIVAGDAGSAAVAAEFAAAKPQLDAAEQHIDNERAARLAKELTHVPAGALVIRHARLFDPRDLSVTPGSSVLIEGARVARVAPDAELAAPEGAEVIDAAGQFLLPGLWDYHQHFFDLVGMFSLAAGVTSARDLGSDSAELSARAARFDSGAELGPRVVKAGLIEGVGANAVPTGMHVETPAAAQAAVDWYADHGYAQVKIYSLLKPELVPLVAERAHARGLRVSGHVPAFMSARQFIGAGADEIQHFNFIILNFLHPAVQDTRGMERFTKMAEHARDFPPDNPQVAEFIRFLRQRHTVLDPTMVVFEGMFSSKDGVSPALEIVAPRFPAQVRRHADWATPLAAPAGQEAAYREAFPAMLRLLKEMHDAGVTIIPGTDSFPGYSLQRELELYVRAGIPAAEVLRMATLTPAQIMGVDKDIGVIAPGKLADMVLIDGDPLKDIADIRHVRTVIKDGKIHDPAAIEQAVGLSPAK